MARLSKGQDFSVYSSPSFNFWYEEKWYTVQGAETMVRIGTKDDMSTMRSEYTRMRDTAQKRLKRLEKSFPKTKAVESHPKGFPKLRDIDPRDFPKAFADLAKFLKAKGSTVTGQRAIMEKTMKKLNTAVGAEEGKGVTPANYWRVIDILERARSQKVVYGSDKMVTLAETTMELTSEQFGDVLDNLESFLKHSDEVQKSVDKYMEKHDISDYQEVDMDDFIKQVGW